MPAAFLPSPASDIWHLGPVPVRAFALCMVAGVLAGLWLTDWRYRRAGGQQGIVLNVATVAVPVGIAGARIYSVLTNSRLYFGHGRDWTNALRIWEGGLGMAGAVAAGALATWAYCRKNDIDLGPLALAAAPALPVTQAIAVWGNWFSQGLYGKPSGLPWAVAIAPAHRAAGYQASATFQPIFLYESLLYLLVAVAVGYAIRRFGLAGDRAFALYAGLYATARIWVEAQRVGYTPHLFGLRTNEAAMLVIMIVAWSYLLVMRSRRRRALAELAYRPGPARPLRPLRPRSGTAAVAADFDHASGPESPGRAAARLKQAAAQPVAGEPVSGALESSRPVSGRPVSGRPGVSVPASRAPEPLPAVVPFSAAIAPEPVAPEAIAPEAIAPEAVAPEAVALAEAVGSETVLRTSASAHEVPGQYLAEPPASAAEQPGPAEPVSL